jgi:hypothetical protein
MAGIDRATIIQGPCLITYASSTFWSKGDVTVKPVFEKFDIETSAWGKVDTRLKNKRYEISFEPDGRVTSALIAILWPYGDSAVGTSIFQTADRALVVHGRDQVKFTFHNAALTEMPSIRMGVGVTFAGACKFTALLKLSTAVTDAAAYYTVATAQAYPAETGWLASDILTQPALCTWGSSPWAAFQVDSPGWEIQPTMRLQPIGTDGFGTVDMTLQGLEVTARAIPVGPTAAQILTAMSATGELGSSLASAGTELVVTSGTSPKAITVTVYNAAMVDSALVWSAAKKRVAQCTWMATRTVTTGDPDPLFSVAIA